MLNQDIKSLLNDVVNTYSKTLTQSLIDEGVIKLLKAKELLLKTDDEPDALEEQFDKKYNLIQNIDRTQIPYICREFYKHTFRKNEDVIIGFCIDNETQDWYYEREEHLYRIKCYVDYKLKSSKVYVGGSNRYNIGNLPLGEHVVALEGEDIYGRVSFRDYFEIRVADEKVVNKYVLTQKDLDKYNIKNDGSDTVNTVTGLNSIINNLDAKYNYLVLPEGKYKMKYGETICMKDNLTLDLNGSLIVLEEGQSGDKNMMINIQQCYDSHVINGTIEGDYYSHDYGNSPNNSEWVHGVDLCGRSKYSSYENITIKNITGYGSCSGMGADRDGKQGYCKVVESPKFTTVGTRSISDLFDLKPFKLEEELNYFQLGKYLGYQGKPSDSWYYKITFYDENENELESFNAYFYRRVYIPDNVFYAKFETFKIANGLSCFAFNVPVNCEFRNVRHDMCRCVGMAPNAMESLRVHGCYFTQCGKSSAKCAFDSEDGWDMMHDFYMDTTVFENNFLNDWLTCAGHNFLLENNEYNGSIYVWTRCQGYVIRNNKVKNISEGANKDTQFVKIYNNECSEAINSSKTLIKDCKAKTISGVAIRSVINSMPYGNFDYNNCIIDFQQSNSGYIGSNKCSFNNCQFKSAAEEIKQINMQFNALDNNRIFKDCVFKDAKYILNCNNNFNSGTFENCVFENSVLIKPTLKEDNNGVIRFKDCTIPFDGALIILSPFAYTMGGLMIEFDNCTLIDTGENAEHYGVRTELIYGFSKPTDGYIKFNNCKIEKDDGYLLGQYSAFNKDHKLDIIFNDCEFSNKDIKVYTQLNMEQDSKVKVTIN